MERGHFIIDGHVHYCAGIEGDYFTALMDRSATDMANLAAISPAGLPDRTAESLALKHRYPGRYYVFGSLDRQLYYSAGMELGAKQAEHAAHLMEMGCDGIKLLEGKPQLRKALPIPDFDHECWEAFWDWAEKRAVPILWHVNDPEEFWDEEKVPVWARAQGWHYGEDYINNEQQYAQVLQVLERHPRLRIDFAHFFFMSAQLQRLEKLMDRYENIHVDLTPGIEMYENFSRQAEETRSFFEKFHDRIIYGTDTASRYAYNTEGKPFNEAENLRRPEIVRAFLMNKEPEKISADGNFLHNRPDFEMLGLGLEGEKLDEILSLNFRRFAGESPAEVKPPLVLEECRRQLGSAGRDENILAAGPDHGGLDKAEAYFSAVCSKNYCK